MLEVVRGNSRLAAVGGGRNHTVLVEKRMIEFNVVVNRQPNPPVFGLVSLLTIAFLRRVFKMEAAQISGQRINVERVNIVNIAQDGELVAGW